MAVYAYFFGIKLYFFLVDLALACAIGLAFLAVAFGFAAFDVDFFVTFLLFAMINLL